MALIRKRRWLAFVLLIASLMAAVGFLGTWFYAPVLIERVVIPKLAARAGITPLALEVRRIGLTGADLGPVRLGPARGPALAVQAVHIDYAPAQLAAGQINRILLSGLQIFATFEDGHLSLRGADLQSFFNNQDRENRKTPSPPAWLPDLPISHVEVRQALVVLSIKEQTYRIPFEIDAVSHQNSAGGFHGTLRLYPRGLSIAVAADIQCDRQAATIQIETRQFELDRFADLTRRLEDLHLSGSMRLNGHIHLRLAPLEITGFDMQSEFCQLKLRYRGFEFSTPRNAQRSERPLRLRVSGGEGDDYRIKADAAALRYGSWIEISNIDVGVSKNPHGLAIEGKYLLGITEDTVMADSALKLPVDLSTPCQFSAQFQNDGTWTFRTANSPPSEPEQRLRAHRLIFFEAYEIASRIPQGALIASGENLRGTVSGKLNMGPLSARTANLTARVPALNLRGELSFDYSAGRQDLAAALAIHAFKPRLIMAAADMKIPALSLEARLQQTVDALRHWRGSLQFKDARMTHPPSGARLEGVCGIIPFEWPSEVPGRKGSIAVASIRWRGQDLGRLAGSVRQQGRGLSLDGRFDDLVFNDFSMTLTAESRLDPAKGLQADFRLSAPLQQVVSSPIISRLLPAGQSLDFNAQLAVSGAGSLDGSRLQSTLNTRIHNGRLRSEPGGILIEGLKLSLELTDLIQIRSAPSQVLSFKQASLGELQMHDGEVEFQIEPTPAVFVERSSANWCGGNISTMGFRIQPEKRDHRLTLHCDRLQLAMILQQLGIAEASGTGSVNGRIPLRIQAESLIFDDGFLYSTPGDGGTIRLSGADMLLAGIPTGTPERAQMELAIAALKDYEYKWAKLNLLTKGETLLLRLQFDGKPANPLPFVYDRKVGRFIRVQSDKGGSKFQGIRLDVNFQLPLDKILRYRRVFEMMQ